MSNSLNLTKVTHKFSITSFEDGDEYFCDGLMDSKKVCLVPVFDCRLPSLPEVHLVLASVKEMDNDVSNPWGLINAPLKIEAIWLKETDLPFFYEAAEINGIPSSTKDLILTSFLKEHDFIKHLYLEANSLAANEPEKVLRLAQERRHDWSVFTSLYALKVQQYLGEFIRKYNYNSRFKIVSGFKEKFKKDAGDGLHPQGCYHLIAVRRNPISGLYDGVGVLESFHGHLFFEIFGAKNDEEIEKQFRNLFGSDFDFDKAQIFSYADSDLFDHSVLDGATDEAFERAESYVNFCNPGQTGIGRMVLLDEEDWFLNHFEPYVGDTKQTS